MALLYTAVFSRIKSRYVRSQVVALAATGVDFILTVFLKEAMGYHYAAAVFIGAICGAFTAFTLNRNWVFAGNQSGYRRQALRYLIALAGSVVLNSSGTWLLTEWLHVPYLVSKVLVAICIGLTYSYYVLKSFVFYERSKT